MHLRDVLFIYDGSRTWYLEYHSKAIKIEFKHFQGVSIEFKHFQLNT